MHPSLEQLHASFVQTLQGRSLEAVEAHPGNDPDRWNARQIVEHLILSYQVSSGVFRERLNKGRPTEYQPTRRQRVMQLFVCRFGYFPSGRVAPSPVIPAPIGTEALDGNALSAGLLFELAAMDDLLIVCKQEFAEKKFATHQVLGPISADQWRKFHVVHGMHHLKQVRRVLSEVASLSEEARIPAEN